MTLAGAREFLTLLSARVPAPVGHRHFLALENGEFVVCMFDHENWVAFELDARDCEKEPKELAGELASLFRRKEATHGCEKEGKEAEASALPPEIRALSKLQQG